MLGYYVYPLELRKWDTEGDSLAMSTVVLHMIGYVLKVDSTASLHEVGKDRGLLGLGFRKQRCMVGRPKERELASIPRMEINKIEKAHIPS